MRSGVSWALLGAIASVCVSCTYLLGVQDLELEPGAGGSGGAGGETTTSNAGGGGSGGAGGGTGGAGGCMDCPENLATGETNPGGIVVRGTNVYWINAATTVKTADNTPPAGSTVLFTSSTLIKIALNNGNIYALLQNGTIEQGVLPLMMAPAPIGGISNATKLTADDTTYYWWDNNQTVYQGPSMQVDTGLTALREMIADSSTGRLYWGRDVAVGSAPLVGGSSTILQNQITSPGVGEGGFAIDADNVYWYDQVSGKIMANPKDTVDDTTEIATADASLIDMAAVGGEVYWIEGDAMDGGDMWKGSAGADKEQVYPGENATSIDVDGTYVYWTTAGSSGSVRRGLR